jgi:L-methionine (R)-S-oxide reductase
VFEPTTIESSSKRELYRQLSEQTRHLVQGEPDEVANLSNVSALLNLHLQDINWVGFYLWREETNELVLGPFQGKPACIRIPMGKGVCGTAAAKEETVVVGDVLSFPSHIACDAESRSEIVVPLIQDEQLIGVLDVDSPYPNRFDQEDANGLEQVANTLLSTLTFKT